MSCHIGGIGDMKFTFDYRAKVRFSHDLSGETEKLDKKFDEMLDFNADKVKSNGVGDLDIYVMGYISELYGVKGTTNYINNGIDIKYEFEYGTVHFWGTAWFDIINTNGFWSDYLTEDFKEYVTEKLCDMDDLNLDLDALYKKWSYLGYDGQVYVDLVEDSARCEASIEQD